MKRRQITRTRWSKVGHSLQRITMSKQLHVWLDQVLRVFGKERVIIVQRNSDTPLQKWWMVFDQSLEERKSNQGIPHVASAQWPSRIFGERQGIQAPEFGTEHQAKLQGKAATLKAFEVIWPLSPRLAMFYAMVQRETLEQPTGLQWEDFGDIYIYESWKLLGRMW